MQTAWPYPIGKYRNTNRSSFGEQVLPHYSDVGFCKSTVQPMKLTCCAFNKIYLVNHCHFILIVVANGYVLTHIGA